MDRRKQALAFGLTWLAYATYYLGRKSFGVVKKPLHDGLGLGTASLGAIDTAFLTAYAFGQFASGWLGDRIGARRLIGYGMLLSAAACALFGAASGVLLFGVLFALNGLAQATGWPGTTRAMAEWTTPQSRGTVMAFWSTCYQVGGIVAVWLAAFLAGEFGWRSAFLVPAVVMAAVALVVLARLPSNDEPIAPAPDGPARNAAPSSGDRALAARAAQRAVLRNPTLWLFGASYFFVKLVRYALLFWLPFFLATAHGHSTEAAARISTAFDAGGILGVIVLGRLSDRSKHLSRAGIASLWLFLLAAVCGAYVHWGASSLLANVALLAVIGALLFGPDALLSGAAAQDAGGRHAAAMATGFVNGVGSIGAILQGLVIPPLAERLGWSALFPAFVVMSLFAAVALIPVARRTVPVRAGPGGGADSLR